MLSIGSAFVIDEDKNSRFYSTRSAARRSLRERIQRFQKLKSDISLFYIVIQFQKNTLFIIHNSLYLNIFAKESIPGGVLALDLLLTVYGPGLGPDGPGCLEKP